MGAEPMTEQSVQGETDRKGWARGLEPAIVWQEFAALAAVPRRSKQEERVRTHVLDRLRSLGLVATTDEAANVIPDVRVSSHAPTETRQALLDMVCEADAGTAADPAIDGVFPVVTG